MQPLGEGMFHHTNAAHVLVYVACTRYTEKQLSMEKLRRKNVKDCNYGEMLKAVKS